MALSPGLHAEGSARREDAEDEEMRRCRADTGRRHTSASRAAVIVSAESIFGAIGAFVVLQE
ncbi:hypothetical protein ACC728_39250, partial [Rhizobium ruizarguesonis]